MSPGGQLSVTASKCRAIVAGMTWLIPVLAAPPAIIVWVAAVSAIAERRAQRARLAVLRNLRPQPPGELRRPSHLAD